MSRNRVLKPVEPESGVLVHSSADRRLAAEHWLLSTLPAPSHERARTEWQEHGVAMLPLGTLFSAVRIPGSLVRTALCAPRLAAGDIDALLAEVLEGGPVVCDPQQNRYYALVPASMPRNWHKAADEWRPMGVGCLGRDTMLGVPPLQRVEPQPLSSYWSVLMSSAGVLCNPLHVARLIAAARRLTGGENA